LIATEGLAEKSPDEESNTEPINFRVPKSLKEKLKLMKEYESVASVGELLRSIAREYIKKTTNSSDFKAWQAIRERSKKNELEAK
jgi:hypothetical protein